MLNPRPVFLHQFQPLHRTAAVRIFIRRRFGQFDHAADVHLNPGQQARRMPHIQLVALDDRLGGEILQRHHGQVRMLQIHRQGDVRVCELQACDVYLPAHQLSRVHVQLQPVHRSHEVPPRLVIENAHLLGDQPAERIDRQRSEVQMHSVTRQFLRHEPVPPLAKGVRRQESPCRQREAEHQKKQKSPKKPKHQAAK